jgi:hypothetical protein
MKPPKLPTTLSPGERLNDLLSSRMLREELSTIIDYLVNHDDFKGLVRLRKTPENRGKGHGTHKDLP